MQVKGTLIRDVNQLNISDEAKTLARELLEQIDMPVVFLIDHNLGRNIYGRHMLNHNQFWVCANTDVGQKEFERIILYGIYKGVQERKRINHPCPKESYEQILDRIPDGKTRDMRHSLYNDLLKRISDFVANIDAELFLKSRGFSTGASQMEWLYEDRMRRLEEYLQIQQKGIFEWYMETELINTVDYARIAYLDSKRYSKMVSWLNNIKPVTTSKRCINRVRDLVRACKLVKQQMSEKSSEEVINWLTNRVIKILQLEEMVHIKRDYVFESTFNFGLEHAKTYSFVPEDVPDSMLLVECFKYANECIVLLRENGGICIKETLSDIHVNLIISDSKQAFSNILDDDYYVGFTAGLLKFVCENIKVEEDELYQNCVSLVGEAEVLRRIRRYAIFYITAHECAHILNEDCSNPEYYNADNDTITKKEALVNAKARSIVKRILPMQYRPDSGKDIWEQRHKMISDGLADEILFAKVCDWCDRNINEC